MKKVFVTGSGGFIGKNLAESLAKDYKVFAPRSSELNLLDAKAVERYMKRHAFDCVVHAAAEVMSRNYTKDVSVMLHNNLLMYFSIARNTKYVGKMLYFGSGAEYDMVHYKKKMPEAYFDTHIPADAYGFSKYIMAKHTVSDPKITDIKLFGCYGKYENWEVRFISNAICKAVFGMDITMKQNVFFDYVYINDVQRVVPLFIEKKKLAFQHYNFCSGTSVDLLTLAKLVKKVSGKKIAIHVAEKGFKQEYSGNNARFKKEFKNFRFTPHEKAIGELYAWYNEHISILDKRLLLSDK